MIAKRPEKATVAIPLELRRRARAKAILEGKTLSSVVRELLELYVADAVLLPKAKGED